MFETLFNYIDAADADGFYSFTMRGHYLRDLPADKWEARTKLLTSHFYNQPLLSLKFRRLKRWVKDVETTSHVDAAGTWHLRINLARAMLLPCENPKAELAELRALFEAMKPFLEAHPHRHADVQICNNRNRNKAVYGTIGCRFEGSKGMESDPVHDPVIRAVVECSPVLQVFLRNIALALQKIGPWSWITFDEDNLYGRHAGPRSQAILADIRAGS